MNLLLLSSPESNIFNPFCHKIYTVEKYNYYNALIKKEPKYVTEHIQAGMVPALDEIISRHVKKTL